MKKKHYIIFSRFLLLVVIVIILTNFFSNNRCQTEIPQINQEATTREMEEYFSLKAYLFTPFMITNKLDYETEFIQNIENIKREYLQREIITAYLQKEPITADVTGSLNQKDFFSNIKETQFYELSTEEKVNILDTSNVNTTYRFGDDVLAMNRRKIYRFGEFQIALCGEYF
jgi:hypothetical protein